MSKQKQEMKVVAEETAKKEKLRLFFASIFAFFGSTWKAFWGNRIFRFILNTVKEIRSFDYIGKVKSVRLRHNIKRFLYLIRVNSPIGFNKSWEISRRRQSQMVKIETLDLDWTDLLELTINTALFVFAVVIPLQNNTFSKSFTFEAHIISLMGLGLMILINSWDKGSGFVEHLLYSSAIVVSLYTVAFSRSTSLPWDANTAFVDVSAWSPLPVIVVPIAVYVLFLFRIIRNLMRIRSNNGKFAFGYSKINALKEWMYVEISFRSKAFVRWLFDLEENLSAEAAGD